MPGSVIGTTMNQGFPGQISRNGDNVVKNYLVKSSDATGPAFGNVVVLNQDSTGGTISDAAVSKANGNTPVGTQGANFAIVGLAVREVLTQIASYVAAQPLTPVIQTYAPGQMADVLERGFMTVQIQNPAAASVVAGGQAYVRLTTGAGTVIGAIEPAADSGHNIAIPNCFFTTGVVDGNGCTEVTLLSRNTP